MVKAWFYNAFLTLRLNRLFDEKSWFFDKGASINDITHFLRFLTPPSPIVTYFTKSNVTFWQIPPPSMWVTSLMNWVKKKIHNFTSPVNIWKNYYYQYWSFDMKSFIFSLVSPTNVKKKISLKLTFYQNVSREKGLIFFEENFKLNLQFFWIHISVLKNK